MPQPDEPDSHPVDAITPWLLVGFAGLCALGALARVLQGGAERLDTTTLLYVAVGAAVVVLRQVKALSFGDYKLEMLERVRERQARQESRLDDIALIVPLLFPTADRQHLLNLYRKQTGQYEGGPWVQQELRRLRTSGLIRSKPDRHIRELRYGVRFDLADYVELTPLGERWAKRLAEMAAAEADAPNPPAN